MKTRRKPSKIPIRSPQLGGINNPRVIQLEMFFFSISSISYCSALSFPTFSRDEQFINSYLDDLVVAVNGFAKKRGRPRSSKSSPPPLSFDGPDEEQTGGQHLPTPPSTTFGINSLPVAERLLSDIAGVFSVYYKILATYLFISRMRTDQTCFEAEDTRKTSVYYKILATYLLSGA